MSTTINKEEIQKFSKLADEWWDVNGKFKPLHMFNPVRIEYITENIKKQFTKKHDFVKIQIFQQFLISTNNSLFPFKIKQFLISI